MKIQSQKKWFNVCVLVLVLAAAGMVLAVSPFSAAVFISSFVIFCLCVCIVTQTHNRQMPALDQMQKDLEREKTAREKIENDLIRVLENAEQTMKIKDEFLANMSHEIRNPMNGIIGMMHVLKDSDLTEDQRKYADIVYNSAQALLVIVNDILDLSKIEAGKLELDIRPFDLEIGIRDMVSLPELQARQKGIDFSYHIDPEVPRLLKGDIGRLRQVILNLIGNAVKFTDSGSVSLAVTLNFDEETRAGLHFCVEDTGIGIKDATITRIFESFNQADVSTTKRFGGTGLGLSISRLLVEKMGGRIGAESVELVGSTFWFELVFEKSSCQEIRMDAGGVSVSDCRLLLVSDVPGAANNLVKQIQHLGAAHELATDGPEAFDRLLSAQAHRHPFHIVLMDVHETSRFARSLGKKICNKKMFAGLKLILITGVGQKGEAREFEKMGFSAFLSKPVDHVLLADCIRTVLAMPSTSDPLPIITRYSIQENRKYARRILVVEDMETNRITARTMISRLGYAVDEASDGRNALEKHARTPYDLILMDCRMPVMDGYEATRQIRLLEDQQKKNRIPIIALTGNAFEQDRKKCFAAGMDDFITKPVQPDILAKKMLLYLSAAPGADSDKTAEPDSDPGDLAEESLRFNKALLWERFGHDGDMIQEILASFFQETPDVLADLAEAVEKLDIQAVTACAHALKGSAANVNADRLKDLAMGLEQDAAKKDKNGLQKMYDDIYKEYERFAGETAL